MKEAFEKIKGGLDEAKIVAPYLARIAELEAENKKLRTELDWAKYCYDDLRAARAALEKKND